MTTVLSTKDKIKDKLFTWCVAIPLAVFFLGFPLWFIIGLSWATADVINGLDVCVK